MKILEIFYPLDFKQMAQKFCANMREIFYPLNGKNIKHAFNCLFRDRIVSVEYPYAHSKSLCTPHCWSVVVNYKYKGRKTFDFDVNDERYITTYGSARAAADSSYNLYRQAMERQRAKQK